MSSSEHSHADQPSNVGISVGCSRTIGKVEHNEPQEPLGSELLVADSPQSRFSSQLPDSRDREESSPIYRDDLPRCSPLAQPPTSPRSAISSEAAT